jgi:hypothetical protein
MSEQEGERDTNSNELGQGEINKDDPPLQNVDAEIGMDEDEQDTGCKGPYQKAKDFHGNLLLQG